MRLFIMAMMAIFQSMITDALHAAGDPAAGKVKAVVCDGCHGLESRNPMAPRLAGQPEAYTIQEIINFRSGLRNDPVMSPMAASLGDDRDIEDIAAYYAALTPRLERPKYLPVALRMGERLYINRCEMCHGIYGRGRRVDEMGAIVGVDGAQNTIGVPVIGGQPKEYLLKALGAFKSGNRTSTFELGMDVVLKRTTQEQIILVASYLSSLAKRMPPPSTLIGGQ